MAAGLPTLRVTEDHLENKKRESGKAGTLLALCLMLVFGGTANAADARSKCDNFIRGRLQSNYSRSVGVLVHFKCKPGASELSRLRSLGADVYRHLPVINSVAVKLPENSLSRVAALDSVERLSWDGNVSKTDAFTNSSSCADAAYQQYGLTGVGVGVAVIDSGVTNEADFNDPLISTGLLGNVALGNRIKAQANFVPTEDAYDHCGHGTHVAGIIAGNASSSSGVGYTKTFWGIARRANLISVKVLDGQGHGNVSQVISGIQWCINNARAYNIRVINLSLGHPVAESYTTDPLCQAVEQAWKSGIVVVCAAGNSGRLTSTPGNTNENEGYGANYGSINSPANDPYVITVGATKSTDGVRVHDRIATYSGRGPTVADMVLKPDIVAPGNKVISVEDPNTYLVSAYSATNLVPWDYYCLLGTKHPSTRYYILSGTSMATPVVSAAAALLLNQNSSLSPDTIKLRLMASADKWADPAGYADPFTYGAGYLNILNALKSTMCASQYAMSPTISWGEDGYAFINSHGTVWGDRAVWGNNVDGTRAVWGNNSFNGDGSINSSRAVWGNNVDGTRAVWGNCLDANRAVWGNNSSVDLSAGSIAIQGEN